MLKKLESATEEEKPLIKSALNIGIKAFSGEVNYDEN